MAKGDPHQDLRLGYWELVQARPAYERALAMYEGTVEEVYASPKVKRLLAKFGLDAIETMNFAHIPVDTVADKLRLNNITADRLDNEAGVFEKNDSVNSVIEDLVEYNELEEELPLLFRNTGKCGDYYMMVWPVVGEEDEEPNVSKAFDTRETVETLATGDPIVEDNEIPDVTNRSVVAVDMMILDPLTTRVYYDDENPKKKKFAIRSWEEGEGQNRLIRVNLYYADRIERWKHIGRPSKRKNAQQKWEPYEDDGNPALLPNPFDEVPIYHFRTDRTYGKPDHFNAYGPQLAINKLVTSHLATVDYQSFPQRYALQDPAVDPAGTGIESDPFAPDDGVDSFPEDEDKESQLEADPGALWELKGMKTVGQFQAADPDAYLKPFDRYVKALAQVTGTPFHYFDRQGERPPSGENIRQVNEQLISKAAARQTSYGSELRKAFTFALNLMGHDVERINVIWEPLENVTSLVEWQAINEKQVAGVPQEVTLVEVGYREAQVQEWQRQAEEQAEKERQQAMEDEERKIRVAGEAKQALINKQEANKSSASTEKSKPTPKDMAPKKK